MRRFQRLILFFVNLMHNNNLLPNRLGLNSLGSSARPLNGTFPPSDRFVRDTIGSRSATNAPKNKKCYLRPTCAPTGASLTLKVLEQQQDSDNGIILKQFGEAGQPQWKIIAEIPAIRPIVEDFYCITLAACSSWSCDTKKHLVSDDVLCVDYSGVSVWSRQQGYKTPAILTKPHESHTCVAKSYLGLVGVGLSTGKLEFSIGSTIVLSKAINQLHWCFSAIKQDPSQAFRSCIPTSILFLGGYSQGEPSGRTYSLAPDLSPFATEDGNPVQVLVGDSLGRVLRLAFCSHRIVVADCISLGTDAVLAMAVSRDEKMVAVSTKSESVLLLENTVISCREFAPLALRTTYTHKSVVRGLAFSPASHQILATGGGRHDRKVRFFRQDTQSMWFEITMPGQVVGIVWLSQWEVFVAIGHSRVYHYKGLGKIISIVEKRVVDNIPGEGYALSAVKTLEGVCITTSHSKLICFTWKASELISGVRAEQVLENPLVLGKRMPQLR